MYTIVFVRSTSELGFDWFAFHLFTYDPDGKVVTDIEDNSTRCLVCRIIRENEIHCGIRVKRPCFFIYYLC